VAELARTQLSQAVASSRPRTASYRPTPALHETRIHDFGTGRESVELETFFGHSGLANWMTRS
jgi:hypothetical protein